MTDVSEKRSAAVKAVAAYVVALVGHYEGVEGFKAVEAAAMRVGSDAVEEAIQYGMIEVGADGVVRTNGGHDMIAAEKRKPVNWNTEPRRES